MIMDKINTGISKDNLENVVSILSTVLADQYILYTKTRNYHWNVTGEDFSEYHKLFGEQYAALEADIDEVAERIRALGGKTPATLGEFSKMTRLNEHPGKYPKASEMMANLLSDHEAIVRNLRNDIQACGDKYADVGTEDFLTQLLEKHEKTAWMLRAILEN
jgi:starvation-inducible DNA-binding protein